MTKSGQHKGVKIRTRGNAWQVDFGTRDGKREMRSFKTQEEAKRAINARVEDDKVSARNQRARLAGLYDLPENTRLDVLAALDELGGKTLTPERGKVLYRAQQGRGRDKKPSASFTLHTGRTGLMPTDHRERLKISNSTLASLRTNLMTARLTR